ncbi:malate synthase G [Corynebacterium halotolerans]|uniref:Malate synthase G n=1 Tax=Corynebacterium halotolerans YIM 70093 = DSM 44683 TaxID=1121362 RepID=M1MW16_9CORY|nr:malate synthase G [Corynebacterium halotolerans]AGF71924.1 malate synthase G [Corynebacterium halotolerans YIM 70093 = DSM 44683]
MIQTKLKDTTERLDVAGLQVAEVLHDFLTDSVLPTVGVDADDFWAGFADLVREFTPRNRKLLARRDELQEQLDEYYRANPGRPDPVEHEKFLRDIGYLVATPAENRIRTRGIDEEVATMAGPQLVVPILNARFAINAANARWGSLYDALYGTNAIPEDGGAGKGREYNPVRGRKVIAWGREFLDAAIPLDGASHADVEKYSILDGYLAATVDGREHRLKDKTVYRGFCGEIDDPGCILLRHNGLHIQLEIDPTSPIGRDDKAGIKDIILESAVTTIMDFEDSVAAVDGEDKTLGYRNWFGLNTGELSEQVTKDGRAFTRTLNPDRSYIGRNGTEIRLHGRSLLFVRNVGHLMRNPAILVDGEEIYEGIMDAVITALCAIPGLNVRNPLRNSRTGSIYIVKPKQHGPEEVAFTNDLFGRVEDLLGLPRYTIKVGVMDEERRTSANLDACIMNVADRLAFINTGFLDRTGDEIHTSMQAGAMVRKADMQTSPWKQAYEDNNVDAGLERGLSGRAQIGKGMWAQTELMAEMLEAKIGQPREGANTAWVPSPTGATLHATHYHRVDVFAAQEELKKAGRRDSLHDLLTVPVAPSADWTEEEKQEELDNNCQSILGYVVRWVEQGVGCSKVPDIHDTALMEDRATLRISSQLLCNWLVHGVVTEEQVIESLERMAAVVDRQNEDDPAYLPMSRDYDYSIAFQAAKDLLLKGAETPSGYTEPILHARRREFKEREGLR